MIEKDTDQKVQAALVLINNKEDSEHNFDVIIKWKIGDFPSGKELLEQAYHSIELLTRAFNKVSFMRALNDMQCELLDSGLEESKFKDKYTIPLYFVNLLLQEFNLKLEWR